jgi:hypothetical protein
MANRQAAAPAAAIPSSLLIGISLSPAAGWLDLGLEFMSAGCGFISVIAIFSLRKYKNKNLDIGKNDIYPPLGR